MELDLDLNCVIAFSDSLLNNKNLIIWFYLDDIPSINAINTISLIYHTNKINFSKLINIEDPLKK
jgi:hypothetical protein